MDPMPAGRGRDSQLRCYQSPLVVTRAPSAFARAAKDFAAPASSKFTSNECPSNSASTMALDRGKSFAVVSRISLVSEILRNPASHPTTLTIGILRSDRWSKRNSPPRSVVTMLVEDRCDEGRLPNGGDSDGSSLALGPLDRHHPRRHPIRVEHLQRQRAQLHSRRRDFA